ncbi:MAG: ABC transporter ATP-binding protein, partial [Deltaproteobacteria bacterium]|nr:ABC transporter ATP-binding protein [Deltaproteobacteria bacterium]
RRVLDGIDFRLEPGEVACVLGPNGAGKSSLLDVALGLLPAEGAVLLEGSPLETLPLRERARLLALSGREELDPHGLTVREIVALGAEARLDGTPPQNLERFLEETGVVEFATRPLGTLSSGERQRVHWARVMAQSPRVLLLDEATTHLDLAHREEAARRVRRFAEAGGAALVVLHEVDVAVRHFPRVLVIARGRLVADGPTTSVLTPALLRDVFGVTADIRSIDGTSHLLVHS